MDNQIYDVIIAGAGPSGSMAALRLSALGKRVRLLDKLIFPRDKPCGGAINKLILEEFPELKPAVDNAVLSANVYSCESAIKLQKGPEKIDYINLKIADMVKLSIERETPVAYMAVRLKFDKFILDKAIEAGAEIGYNESVLNYEPIHIEQNEYIRITVLSNAQSEGNKNQIKTYITKWLIGAGGINCKIASKIRQKYKINQSWNEHKSFALEMEISIQEGILDRYFSKSRKSILFYKFGFEHGYGWIFSKKESLNIGIGAFGFPLDKLRPLFYDFMQFLTKNDIIPHIDLTSQRLQGAYIPAFGILKKPYEDRVLLVGDALGANDASNGEGILYALRSANFAAITINNCLDNKLSVKAACKKYTQLCFQSFGKLICGNAKNLTKNIDLLVKVIQLSANDPKLQKLLEQIVAQEVSMEKLSIKIKLLVKLLMGTFHK